MTCIVGLADPDGCVWIGGDSAATNDSDMQTIRADPKVFFIAPAHEHGAPTVLVGGTTSFRFLNLLQYKLVLPSYDQAMHPKKYLVTVFVDAVRECLKLSGYDKKDEGEELGGEFLLGWQGKLYHISDDYQIGEPAVGYHAVGSGASVALGVMFATQGLPPEERIHLALQASAYHCSSVRAPFVIEKSAPPSTGEYAFEERIEAKS